MLYRGSTLEKLTGCYLYADWGMGKVWAMRPPEHPGERAADIRLLYQASEVGCSPTLICPDENGEALILNQRGWIAELVEVTGD